MTEKWAFVVPHVAAGVLVEQLGPTEDDHDISFVGERIEDDESFALTAMGALKSRLGLRVRYHELGKPIFKSYHAKTGAFYKLLLPADTRLNGTHGGIEAISFGDLQQIAPSALLELSRIYFEEELA